MVQRETEAIKGNLFRFGAETAAGIQALLVLDERWMLNYFFFRWRIEKHEGHFYVYHIKLDSHSLFFFGGGG